VTTQPLEILIVYDFDEDYMRGGHQIGGPLVKRTLSRAAGLSLHIVGGIPTHDPTNNFKMYSRRLLDNVEIESHAGFELAIELTVKAHLLGLPILEIPTTWRDRSAGDSRFRLWAWLPQLLALVSTGHVKPVSPSLMGQAKVVGPASIMQ
jgi:hypothetical protein